MVILQTVWTASSPKDRPENCGLESHPTVTLQAILRGSMLLYQKRNGHQSRAGKFVIHNAIYVEKEKTMKISDRVDKDRQVGAKVCRET